MPTAKSVTAPRRARAPTPTRAARSPQRALADELLFELSDLPSAVCRLVDRYSVLADDLVHAANAIASILGSLTGAEPEELRRAPVELEACVERVDRMLRSLLAFAGEMRGLAWAVEAVERARQAAQGG